MFLILYVFAVKMARSVVFLKHTNQYLGVSFTWGGFVRVRVCVRVCLRACVNERKPGSESHRSGFTFH